MKLDIEKPHIRAFRDHSNRVRYFIYDMGGSSMFDSEHIGDLLVEFVLSDLKSYETEINRLNQLLENKPKDSELYDIYLQVLKASDMLKRPCPIAYFYTVKYLNDTFRFEVTSDNLKYAIRVLDNILILKEDFEKGIEMCLDIDFEKPLSSTSTSYLAFLSLTKFYTNMYLITGIAVAPINKGKLDFQKVEDIGQNPTRDFERNEEILTQIETNSPASIAEYTLLSHFDEFLYFEFIELIKRDVRVRKCKNCDKYFVLKTRHQTLFCDRKFADGKTCKEIGNKLKYNEKIANDELLKRYKQIYKSNHARMERKIDSEYDFENVDIIRTSFEDWSRLLKETRVKYEKNEITDVEFKAFLETTRWEQKKILLS